MKVEFRKSFEKDLSKLRDEALLTRIKAVILEIEDAETLLNKQFGAAMKAIKVMATIDDQGQLALDYPLITDKNSRVEVIVLIPEKTEIDENDQPKEAILEDFRQAWHEAMTGQTIPVAQLWAGLEDV